MADAKKGVRPGKPVFKLDVPFTQIQWPQLATVDHDIMLEILVNLLAPIGQYRSTHITPSKGKRSKKRKRHGAPNAPQPIAAPPPPPNLARHITLGINSTTRHLEQLAQGAHAPHTHKTASGETDASQQPHTAAKGETEAPSPSDPLQHLPLIFVLQPPSSITISHLPLLVHTVSHKLDSSNFTRLVPLKPSSEPKVAAALGLPRAGVIGIMEGAPGAEHLVAYARQKVSATDVPWLREASEGHYLPVKVLTEQSGTKTGPKN